MNDRYGWDDREDRDRYRRHSSDHSRGQGANYSDRWRNQDDDWTSQSRHSQGRTDFDREQRYGGSGTFGYGEGRSGAGHRERQVGGYGGSSYGGQQSHASQSDERARRYSSSDYGYGAGYGGQQGDGGQTFTGQQHAWEVPSSYGAPGTFGASYGGGTGTYDGGAGGAQGYGADYRDHGYAGRQNERGFLQRAGDEVASWFGDEDAARRREADHRGRGPSDYTRSDERIREDANDRLTEDWRVDASRISVAVQDGEITLSGTVTRRDDKRRAEDIVEDLSGVKHVQNNLRVNQQTSWSGASSATTFGSSSTGASTAAAKTDPEPPQT